MNSQPLKYEKVPAGKKINNPIRTTPNVNFVIASISNFVVIIKLLKF